MLAFFTGKREALNNLDINFEIVYDEFLSLPFLLQISVLITCALLVILYYDHYLAFVDLPPQNRQILRPLRNFLHRFAVILILILVMLNYGFDGLFSALFMMFFVKRYYHLLICVLLIHLIVLYYSNAQKRIKYNYFWF